MSAPAYDNLPDLPALARLKKYNKWVAWKYGQRNGPKLAKLSVNPRTGGNASVDKPNTWGSYDQAVTRTRRGKLAGVGYVLTEEYWDGPPLLRNLAAGPTVAVP